MGDNADEAKKLMKQATKLLGPSILDFRLKPDWEAAAPLLERAALLYKQAGMVEKAIEAYEKASMAQDKIKSPFHAAKHLETCAELSRQMKQWDKVAEYFKTAAELYVNSNKTTAGGDCLAKGARIIEDYDYDTAIHMLFDAVDMYEMEDRGGNAADIFRQAIALSAKCKRYHDTVELLMRFGAACDKAKAHSSQCKAYLGAIVVQLYTKDAKAAWHTFQDVLLVDAFVSSDEAFAADALFQAYRTGDEEAVKALIAKKSIFRNLENQVSRLALKLPTGNMEKLARRLNRVMGPDEEEEEDNGEEGQQPEADELM